MRSIAPLYRQQGTERANALSKTKRRFINDKHLNENNVFSAFQHFRSSNQQIYPLNIVKSDNMWTHTGQLERPLEILIQNRYPITEIIFANEVIAVRSANGLCAIYKNWTDEFLCYLNAGNGEIIRSIYFNSLRDELLIVSCSQENDFASLSCFSVKTSDLLRCRVENRTKLFTREPIKYPGFIEFDNPNKRAVLFLGEKSNYQIFTLEDYTEIFQLPSRLISDIKLTPGAFMLFKLEAFKFTIIFHDVNSGEMKGEVTFNLKNMDNIEFIERIDLTVVYKQQGHALNVFDIQTGQTKIIQGTENSLSTDFAFLYPAKKFIIYKRGVFDVYSFDGTKQFTLTAQPGSKLEQAPMCVCQTQKYFICTSRKNAQRVYMFSLQDGSEVFSSEIDRRVMNGFSMTSIAYDDESHCIVCGDEVGTSHFWL